MGKAWQTLKRKALHPIPRVVDNTEALAIEQLGVDLVHSRKVRPADMPSGPGSFSPYGNTNFR